MVRAGLLPALSAGALAGSEEWPQVVVTAGPHAVDALAELTGEEPPPVPVVLVVDQLEQQWSTETDPGERTAFLDSVLGLVAEGHVGRCILVIRADHIGLLAEHRGMAGRMVGCLELVPPLTEPQLREVLEWPAAAAGLTVEPELVDTVVREVLGRNGGLPLMSMAMVGTWARRHDDTLTLAGYLARVESRGRSPPPRKECSPRSTRTIARSPARCSSGWPSTTSKARSSAGGCRSRSSTWADPAGRPAGPSSRRWSPTGC